MYCLLLEGGEPDGRDRGLVQEKASKVTIGFKAINRTMIGIVIPVLTLLHLFLG
jgi:hypothetical protein